MCSPGTSANIALSNWTGITIGQASIIVELIMLIIATKMKEGIGLTSIVNAILGGIMTDRFDRKYNELMELRVKLELAPENEKGLIEEKIKEVEYELAYLEYTWLYE